jgi:hypothetical protein
MLETAHETTAFRFLGDDEFLALTAEERFEYLLRAVEAKKILARQMGADILEIRPVFKVR